MDSKHLHLFLTKKHTHKYLSTNAPFLRLDTGLLRHKGSGFRSVRKILYGCLPNGSGRANLPILE